MGQILKVENVQTHKTFAFLANMTDKWSSTACVLREEIRYVLESTFQVQKLLDGRTSVKTNQRYCRFLVQKSRV